MVYPINNLLRLPISDHNVCGVITAGNLTPFERDE